MAGGNNNDSSPGRGRGGRGRGSGRGSPGGRGGRGDNGGRGRGPGRGRSDNGGRGGGGGRGRGGPSNRQDRKANRRQKQLETMARKAAEEDAYFRQCQREAQNNNNNNKSPKDDTSKAREDELFGKQMVKGINFEKYNQIKVEVKVPEASNKEAVPAMEDFTKLPHLNPQLQKNIQLMKYTHPTPIQKNAIPLAMAGEDLMCCAQTGSGKTCAFLLPIVAALGKQQPKKQNKGRNKKNNNNKKNAGDNDNNNNDNSNNNQNKKAPLEPAKPKCIVLAPTRELAMQIELEAEKLTHAMPSLQPVVVYGGANPKAQLKELAYASSSSNDNDNDNHHLIVVATPGRLTDFVDRNLVSLSDVQYLVLDEADRCLDMGFEPQVRKIVQESGMTPKDKRQTFLFSATFPPAIQKLASEFLRTNYVWIAIGRVGSTTDSITQVLVKATADKRRKLELVVQALEKGPKGRTLIFVQKKRTATWLKKQLNKGGPDAPNKRGDASANRKQQQQPYQGKELKFTPIAAEEIHGDRSQAQREAALEKFRAGKCKVLVATDVAARGLDIPGVEHVINMDLPTAEEEFDSYVHRIGRTGRAGNEGLATSLFVPGDNPKSENGRIASLLVKQLKECKQEVPPWLASLVLGGGGGNNNNKGKPQFTSTDVRKNTSRPARSNNNNNNNNNANSRDGSVDGNNNNNGKSEQQGGRGQGGSNQSGRGGEGRGRGRGGRGRGGREGRGRGNSNNASSNKGDDNQQPKSDEKTAEGGNKPSKDQTESNGNSDNNNTAGRSGGRGGRGRGRGRGRGSGRGRGRKPGRDNE